MDIRKRTVVWSVDCMDVRRTVADETRHPHGCGGKQEEKKRKEQKKKKKKAWSSKRIRSYRTEIESIDGFPSTG